MSRLRRRQSDDDSPERKPGASRGFAKRRAVPILVAAMVLLLGAYIAALLLSAPSSPGRQLRYDQFLGEIRAARVDSATVLIGDRRIVGNDTGGGYWLSYGESVDGNPFFTRILGELENAHVQVTVDQQWYKGLIGPLTVLLPTLLLVLGFLLIVVLTRNEPGGTLAGFGRSGSRRVARGDTRVTFADVAGVDEAIEELVEIRDYLTDPGRFLAMGARVPSGILLVGPPGCGKTLLARAVAGEAAVPFFSISGSDFVEIFVGVGAARIRDLFRQAQESSPAIVFIDELDAVGRGRSASAAAGQDEREATLNQLLVGLDGFESETGIVVLAATNRPDVLDPALLRAGRFDRRVVVDLPDAAGRLGILKVHARGKPLAADVNLDALARRTAGFSGADLANVVNEAALLAARRERTEIAQALLSEAVERLVAGPERRSRLIGPRDKRVTAYHEAGHALVSAVLSPLDRVTKISIIARGRGGGFTWLVADDDRQLATREQLAGRLAALMGGRAAESISCGQPTSGSEDDLLRASELARRMVADLGMSDRIGPVSMRVSASRMMAEGDALGRFSERLASAVDEEVGRLLTEAHADATRVLLADRELLERLADRLVEVETLEGVELDAMLYPAAAAAAAAATP